MSEKNAEIVSILGLATIDIITNYNRFFIALFQIGTYAGGGGVSRCPGAAGGNGGQQGQPTQGSCGSSQSGKAGTESLGGEGGNFRVV